MYYVNYIYKTSPTTATTGWASYESENEMYADLETQGITEENLDILVIEYYNESGKLFN